MRYSAVVIAAFTLCTVNFADAATPDAKPVAFTPPPYEAMPGGELGDAVRLGENVFRHTTIYAKERHRQCAELQQLPY